MAMALMLICFLGAWLLLWAIVIGCALLGRLESDRRSLTLLDDSHLEP